MDIIQASILGLIQGLTEFIPVSSSGHLVLIRILFGWEDTGVAFDTILHLGTLLAVFICFWSTWKSLLFTIWNLLSGLWHKQNLQKIKKEDKGLLLALLIGTLPAAVMGFFMRDLVDGFFRDVFWVAFFLICTGVLFIIIERLDIARVPKKNNEILKVTSLSSKQAFFIGLMQAVAILPGVSRSGMTIAGGMFVGFNREKAARFAFLLSAPIILAAGLVGLFEISSTGFAGIGLWSVIIGFVVAAVSGYLAIKMMLQFLKSKKLYIFSIYLFIVGILILILM